MSCELAGRFVSTRLTACNIVASQMYGIGYETPQIDNMEGRGQLEDISHVVFKYFRVNIICNPQNDIWKEMYPTFQEIVIQCLLTPDQQFPCSLSSDRL